MKKPVLSLFALALLLTAGVDIASAQAAASMAAVAQTRSAVAGAQAFVNTLTAEQRGKVQFDLSAPTKTSAAKFKGGMDFIGEQYGKAVWSNYPVSDVPVRAWQWAP